jgi:hypothetical protein
MGAGAHHGGDLPDALAIGPAWSIICNKGAHMNTATAEEVTGLLGEVDPIVVDRILAIGASAEEVGEALAEIEDEDGYGELHHPPSSPRVAEVRAVLEELVLEEPQEEPFGGPSMAEGA